MGVWFAVWFVCGADADFVFSGAGECASFVFCSFGLIVA